MDRDITQLPIGSTIADIPQNARIVPLLPIHRHCLTIQDADPHIFNVVSLYEVPDDINPQAVLLATQAIIARHDALRIRFVMSKNIWQTFIAEYDDVIPFSYIDLSSIENDQQSKYTEDLIEKFQTTLHLEKGPILRVVQFFCGHNRNGRLLIMVHHFACDAFSKRILLADFFAAYDQIQKGLKLQFGSKSDSIEDYAKYLFGFAHSDNILKEVKYWTLPSRRQVVPIPIDYPKGLTIPAVKRSIEFQYSQIGTTNILRLARNKISVRAVLLAALFRASTHYTGGKSMLVELINHGRVPPSPEVNLLYTIGWLNNLVPFFIDGSDIVDSRELLYQIEQQLRLIPNDGLGYTVLRHMRDDEVGQLFRSLPQPQILLNYKGMFKKRVPAPLTKGLASMIKRAPEEVRGSQSSRRIDPVGIWLTAHISESYLHVMWEYQENLYLRETIERLMGVFKKALDDISSPFS